MEIRYRMLDVGYIQLGGSPMMVGKPIHEISSCGGRCLLRFAKTCVTKVSIGGIDDTLFEEPWKERRRSVGGSSLLFYF